MKKQLNTRLAAWSIFSLTLCASWLLTACGSDDGQDGADGANGIDGDDGVNGSVGMDGMNGNNGMDGGMGGAGADGMDGAPGMDGDDGMNGAPGFARATLYLSSNGPNNAGTVSRLNESFQRTQWIAPGNNEGLAVLRSGDLVQAGDGANGPSLRTFCAVNRRSEGAAYSPAIDHEIKGALTELVNPKGFTVAHKAGLLFVANFNDSSIKVFGSTAAGNVAPVATTDLDAEPWDVDYDEVNDRLFVALTNGAIAVFDAYVNGGFSAVASRTIVPADQEGEKISTNLHGIVYDSSGDRLIVSDVGDAASADDGSLYVISEASSADGNVEPMRTIAGPNSLLGNPVDLVLTGSDLRVAEKAGDYILTFSDIFYGPSGNIAPTLKVASTKPEALSVYQPAMFPAPSVSDISNAGLTIPYVSVTSNPGPGSGTTGDIARIGSALGSALTTFDAGINLESLTFDQNGDVYATFDDGVSAGGGIFIGNRVATSREGDSASSSRDRTITGANTGLIAPKGLDLDSSLGVVMVAEFSATSPGVFVFSTCASGDVAPLAVASTEGARPWDVDYDAATDRLFVAFTNGTVGVYDQLSLTWGAAGPTRVITPADLGIKISTNLHGIDYDPGSDTLLLSDVGDASVATDGLLFVLPGASWADGLTQVSVQIGGPATNLGNPVDIAFDGKNLYVAEKSNDMIMRFDSVIESSGGEVSASQVYSFVKPESVALNPAYLWSVTSH